MVLDPPLTVLSGVSIVSILKSTFTHKPSIHSTKVKTLRIILHKYGENNKEPLYWPWTTKSERFHELKSTVRLLPFVIIAVFINLTSGSLLSRVKYYKPLHIISSILIRLVVLSTTYISILHQMLARHIEHALLELWSFCLSNISML